MLPENNSYRSNLMKLENFKKNSISWICIGWACLALNACLSPDDPGNSNLATFNAKDMSISSYPNYVVKARLVYSGTYCKVYKDRSDSYMSDNDSIAMGREFDNNIYEKIVSAFGTPCDVDKNGKIILLILDIKDGNSDSSYYAGYFDPTNEFNASAANGTQYSNECDMLYMDSNPGADYPSTFKETMAHEFQHLIDFNQKFFVQHSTTGFDTWINEGMSSAAEKIYSGAQIQDRIDYFNKDQYHDIARGQRFIAWERGDYKLMGNYSTVYLFFQWLNIQSENDYSIYKVIMNSDYDNCQAVYDAAKSHLTDLPAAVSSFPDLLREWSIANLLCQNSGIYGYKEEISTTVHYINYNTDNPSYSSVSGRNMLPGECIYAKITDSFTLAAAASNISGSGVNTSSPYDIDNTGTVYSGDVLVIYNTTSSDSATVSSTGSLPGEVASVSRSKSVVISDSAARKFPVDKVLKFDGINFGK